MPTYNPKLAESFAHIATCTVSRGLPQVEDHQAVAYISRVAIELAIKALLEKAGVSEKSIRALSHGLSSLLRELDSCMVTVAGVALPVPASRVRGRTIWWNEGAVTLGSIIDAESAGASGFPGEFRYGPPPTDYPAEVLAEAAESLCAWAAEQWDSITARSGA